MPIPSIDQNKLLDDATVALERLSRSIPYSIGSSDVDYIPNETTRKAYESLLKVQQTVGENPEAITQFKRRGQLSQIINELGQKLNSPSVQTALGTLASELMGVFNKVQIAFQEKDPRKVLRKDSDPLGRN
jgi:hypothetical protein